MGKEFNPHIDYSIRFNGSENITKVKISLFDLEERGLRDCLKEKLQGEIFINTYDIAFRKIHLTHIKDFVREKDNGGDRKFKKEYSRRENNGRYNREFNDKGFRVYLDTIKDLPMDSPEYIDVSAENERRAIVRALHSIKVFDFPAEWYNAQVESL
jgi:hypothetical protein